QVFMQTMTGMLRIARATVADAVENVARANPQNPLVDFLEDLQWDGEKRLDSFLTSGFGVINADEEQAGYTQAVGRNFLISMVARARQPGCKADHLLMIEGPQGIRKSSALEIIGRPYFAELHQSIDSKDFYIRLRGVWLVELSELSALNGAGVERLKGALSCRSDFYRPPYGKRATEHPRMSVFAATTNESHYLLDTTGNRRFWPIHAGMIDLDWLERYRDQLLAEAVHAVRAGESWHQVPKLAARKQQSQREP